MDMQQTLYHTTLVIFARLSSAHGLVYLLQLLCLVLVVPTHTTTRWDFVEGRFEWIVVHADLLEFSQAAQLLREPPDIVVIGMQSL